jgi:hypothetical protein
MDIVSITDMHSLIDTFNKIETRLGGDLWWRGQANASWLLLPGIHRTGLPDSEKNLTARFVQKVPPRYPDHPEFNDFPGWLFLLQHYRFPTRLLDWTESPLIACHFAVTECLEDDGAIWVLDPFKLNGNQFGRAVTFSDFSQEVGPLFAAALKEQATDIPKVAALTSTERNIRMLVQMSRFTIHGLKESLESQPWTNEVLVKIVVPMKAKPQIAAFLFSMGVRLANLFPDLEHLAKDILGRRYKPV